MSALNTNTAGYLHTYLAYRLPKGATVKNVSGEDIVLSNEEDTLVLTKESSRQLVKDRKDYWNKLFGQVESAAQKSGNSAAEKQAKDQAKAMAVYRSLVKGDIVPASDEQKLLQYNKDLYQAAKMAQAMAQQRAKKVESKKSEWDEDEEREYQKKQAALDKAAREASDGSIVAMQEFSGRAQQRNIVELDSSEADLSSLRVMSLGMGLVGEYVNLSI